MDSDYIARDLQKSLDDVTASRDAWRKVAINAYEYGFMYFDNAEKRAQKDYEKEMRHE